MLTETDLQNIAILIQASEERTAHLIAAEIGASHTTTQRAIEAATETIARTTAHAIEASENRLLIAFHQFEKAP